MTGFYFWIESFEWQTQTSDSFQPTSCSSLMQWSDAFAYLWSFYTFVWWVFRSVDNVQSS